MVSATIVWAWIPPPCAVTTTLYVPCAAVKVDVGCPVALLPEPHPTNSSATTSARSMNANRFRLPTAGNNTTPKAGNANIAHKARAPRVCPTVVAVLMVIVTVVVPCPALEGLNAKLAFAGKPEQENATVTPVFTTTISGTCTDCPLVTATAGFVTAKVTGAAVIATSLAESFATFSPPPPDTVTLLVTVAAALLPTLTAIVTAG